MIEKWCFSRINFYQFLYWESYPKVSTYHIFIEFFNPQFSYQAYALKSLVHPLNIQTERIESSCFEWQLK